MLGTVATRILQVMLSDCFVAEVDAYQDGLCALDQGLYGGSCMPER